MKRKIYFLIFLLLVSCIQKTETDPTVLIRLILKNQELVTLKGKVSGPGTVKNATVSIIALPSNGRCVTEDGKPNGNVLATAKTNDLGEYTLSYTRTNSTPCLVVTGSEGSTMEVNYGNKKPVSWSGNHLFSVFQEPRSFQRNSNGQLAASKVVNANPFTRLASSRFLASRTAQNASTRKSLSTYLRSFFKKSQTEEELLKIAYLQVLQTFFKGMNSKNFKLEEINPDTKTFQARLGAIQTYAEKVGLPKGAPKSQYTGNIDSLNLVKVLNFMDRDFSDGSFDGKEIKENGESSQISLAELGELGLDLSSADSFLKGEFYDALKYFVDFHDDFSDNFWRGISFCDSDNEDCELSLSEWEYPFFIYPFDGQTSGFSSFFFVSLSFFEEIEPSSLSLQTQDGACSGTIQISSDDFTTCLGGSLELDSFFAVIYNENTSFQTGNTYKVKITSIRKADGTALLSTPYVMQTGFIISPSLYAISNELVYDDFNYAVWTRCLLGTSWDGYGCSGTASNFQFCTSSDNSCNGGITGGFLSLGPLYDACENLNTIQYGGVIGWRVPYSWELWILSSHLNFSNVISDYEKDVWSANSDEGDSSSALYFSSGAQANTNKTTSKAVHCISNFIPSLP